MIGSPGTKTTEDPTFGTTSEPARPHKKMKKILASTPIIEAPKLTLKLFAHILNDLDLKGSPLEGENFIHTTSYMYHFLKDMLAEKILPDLIGKNEKEAFNIKCEKLFTLFEDIISIQKVINEETKEGSTLKQALANISQYIVKLFQEKQQVVIPGGWSGTASSSGHAMLYEFRKKRNDDILFLVWNTGAGISNHKKVESTKGWVYHTVKSYCLFNESYLPKFIKKLLKPNIHSIYKPFKRYDATEVYHKHIHHIQYIGGREIAPPEDVSETIQPQWSGTCAWRVVEALTRNAIFKPGEFSPLRYSLLYTTLDKFYTKMQEKDWQDSGTVHQLQLGVKNFALFLKASGKELAPQYEKNGLALIKQINESIQNNKKMLAEDNTSEAMPTWVKNNTFKVKLGSFDDFKLEKSDEFEKIVLQELPNLQNVSFDNLAAIIKKLIEQTEHPDRAINQLRNCEHVLLHLPLEKSFWHAQSKSDLFNFATLLYDLTFKYISLLHYQSVFSFSERVTAVISAFVVLEIFSRKLFDNDDGQLDRSIQGIFSNNFGTSYRSFRELVQYQLRNTFFSVVSEHVDNRLKQIEEIDYSLMQQIRSDRYYPDFIATVCHTELLEKEALNDASMLRHFNVEAALVPGLYYFLNSRHIVEQYRIKHGKLIKERYPEIEQAIQFYLTLHSISDVVNRISAYSFDKLKRPESLWENVSLRKGKPQSAIFSSSRFEPHDPKYNYPQIYSIKDTSYIDDLWKHPKANDIQIKGFPEKLTTPTDLRRRLCHLHANEKTQLVAIIEFLQSSLTEFQEKDVQQTIFVILFQNDYLLKEIKNNPQTIDALIHCLNKAANYFERKTSLLPMVGILKIQLFLYKLLINIAEKNELKGLGEQIRQLEKSNLIYPIICRLEKKSSLSTTEKELLCSLYYLRIIFLQCQYSYHKHSTLAEWQEFFKLNYLTGQEDSNIDHFVVKEKEYAVDALNTASQRMDFDSSILQSVLLAAKITTPHSAFKGEFPHFYAGELSIDLHRALILTQGQIQVQLPFHFKKEDAFKSLFANTDFIATKIGKGMYAFTDHGIQYRITGFGKGLDLRRLFRINNSVEWFKLAINGYPLVDAMKKEDGQIVDTQKKEDGQTVDTQQKEDDQIADTLKKDGLNCLTLMSQNKLIWANKNGYLITDKDSREVLYLIEKYGDKLSDELFETHVYRYNQNKVIQWRMIRLNDSLRFLSNFEDERFIEIYYDIIAKDGYLILFPRYGLSFNANVHNNKIAIFSKEYPGFQLLPHNKGPIPQFTTQLVLAPTASIADQSTYLYLVPKQVFAPSKKNSISYYQYQLDIAHDFKLFAAADKMDRKGNYLKHFNPQLNYFDQQETVIVLKHDTQGELETQNVEDRLYLAYLYFGNAMPEQALAILRTAANVFSGKPKELEYLIDILKHAPYKRSCTFDADAEKVKKNGPDYVAVRIFVYYMLANYLQQGIKTIFPEMDSRIKGHANIKAYEYKLNLIKKRLSIEYLKPIIKSHLNTYFSIRQAIPKAMRLRNEELYLLTNTVIEPHTTIPPLAAQFNRQKLMLDYARCRLLSLNELAKGHDLNPHQLDRLAKLKALTQKDIALKSQATEFVVEKMTSLDLRPYEFGKIKKNRGILEIGDLTLQTNADHIAQYYIQLYNEAISAPTKEKVLLEFLETKLKTLLPSQRALLTEKPNAIIPIVLLKSMLAHQDKTKELLTKCMQIIYEKVITTLTGEPLTVKSLDEALIKVLGGITYTMDVPTTKIVDSDKQQILLQKSLPIVLAPKGPPLLAPIYASFEELLQASHYQELFKPKLAAETMLCEKDAFFRNMRKQKSTFMQTLIDEANSDLEVGREQNRSVLELNQYYYARLKDKALQVTLLESIQTKLKDGKPKFQGLGEKIVAFINQGPTGAQDKIKWDIGLAGKSHQAFTLHEALIYLAKYTPNEVSTDRKLPDKETSELYSLYFTYLIEGTKQQQLTRACKLLTDIAKLTSSDADEPAKSQLIYSLGATITQKRCYDPAENLKILLFEFLDNKLIFPKQFSLLQKLLERKDSQDSIKYSTEFVSRVIPLIMGGGKSKVITPLAAVLRGDGSNLNIIEVPTELFATSLVDLNEIAGRVFAQNILAFEFSRETKTNAYYFYQLHRKLQTIISTRGCLLTTRESLDSLMLKYIEILTTPLEDLVEWERQIKYASKVINIIKFQGDLLIDEMDSILSEIRQLIYTIEAGQPIPKPVLESIIALYLYMANINTRINGGEYNLFKLAIGKSIRPEKSIMVHLLSLLLDKLVSDENSPIKTIISKLNKDEHENIRLFFSNKCKAIPDSILTLDTAERDILAIYKEQLFRLLKVTLNKNPNEHFGLPKKMSKEPIEMEVAIPFKSNNTPHPSAKFQNQFITSNYTLQVQFGRQVISENLFNALIKKFKISYDTEKDSITFSRERAEAIKKEFASIVKDVDLDFIDLDDQKSLSELYANHKNDLNILKYCLLNMVLPLITTNPISLVADAQNHIDMVNTAAGFTGTDHLYRTFPLKVIRSNEESVGTDGQTIDHLLRHEKEVPPLVLKSADYSEVFDIIKTHPKKEHVRAIIDVGALFNGIANYDVAQKLAQDFYRHKINSKIKFILYFNDEDLLSAIPVSADRHATPILLRSTENIAPRLNCESDEYFTYYNQNKITGIDIFQAPHTIALTPIGRVNKLRDILQAVMRLRGLAQTHRAQLVVTQPLQTTYLKVKDWTVQAILNIAFVDIQSRALMESHLNSAHQKIHNVFRSDLLNRIRNEKSIAKKIILGDAFRNFFYDIDDASLFEKYAPIEKVITIEKILKTFAKLQLKKWRSCLTAAMDIEPSKEEHESLLKEIEGILKQAIPICQPKQHSRATQSVEGQVIAQVETQNENEAQKEQEQENEQEVAAAKRNAIRHVTWDGSYTDYREAYDRNPKRKAVDFNQWFPGTTEFGEVTCKTLEQIVATHNHAKGFNFSDNIHASVNFYETCDPAPFDKLNNFKKPCYYILAIDRDSILHQVLITNQEAAEIKKLLEGIKKPIWIETVGGIYYCGQKPEGIEKTSQYQIQMEQIRYYNGDVSYLIQEMDSLKWFKENEQAKLDFLENHILRFHPSKATLFSILKSARTPFQKKTSAYEIFKQDASWERLQSLYQEPSKHNSTLAGADLKLIQEYCEFRKGLSTSSIEAAKKLKNKQHSLNIRLKKLVTRRHKGSELMNLSEPVNTLILSKPVKNGENMDRSEYSLNKKKRHFGSDTNDPNPKRLRESSVL